jgi:hypothetical protein
LDFKKINENILHVEKDEKDEKKDEEKKEMFIKKVKEFPISNRLKFNDTYENLLYIYPKSLNLNHKSLNLSFSRNIICFFYFNIKVNFTINKRCDKNKRFI